MNLIKLTFLFIFLIIALKIILKLLNIKYLNFQNRFTKNKLTYGLTSRYYLSKLTNIEFIDFCRIFLYKRGYKNIKTIYEKFKSGITFIATFKHKTVYIYCFKSSYNTSTSDNNNSTLHSEDNYSKITNTDIQKLIGAMVKDNIHNAVIITNGSICYEGLDYIKNLPKAYNINLLYGINFFKACFDIRANTIKKEMLQNSYE